MSACGQMEEDSAAEEMGAPNRDAEQKSVSKVVRVLTVLAYLLSVSLAAILLSVYYVWVWKSPTLAPLNETMASALRADHADDTFQTTLYHGSSPHQEVSSSRHRRRDPAPRVARGASPNWGISISVSQLPGFGAESVRRCTLVEGAGHDVGQVVYFGQRALVRRLRAAGHSQRARGGAGRALRAETRQEERARADCHHLCVLRLARRNHALPVLRVLLGAQGRAIRATQGGTHCREANQHHTNAHMLNAPHRRKQYHSERKYSSSNSQLHRRLPERDRRRRRCGARRGQHDGDQLLDHHFAQH